MDTDPATRLAAEDLQFDHLVLGAGMAADSAARGIRELDATASIGLVGREPTPPVTRPALSKKLWTDPDFAFDEVWLGTAEDTGAEVLLDTVAERIDTAARTVTTADGRVLTYGRLLLATSGTPASLPVTDDHDSGRVIAFRSVGDYRRLRQLVAPGARVAVVGGSYIATEIAAALAGLELDVALVFRQEVLMDDVLPAGLAAAVQDEFAAHGVRVVASTEVTGGEVAGPDGPVRLELSDGDPLEVDVVVSGLGISLETGFVADAGIETSDDGGVVVDEQLRTSTPSVYAAGDVAQYPDAILGRRRVEHVDNAQAMGTQAGRNMAGAGEAYTHTPYYYSVLFGHRYEAVGSLDASLETVEDWSGSDGDGLTGRSGVVYYVEASDEGTGGTGPVRVRGVLLWNVEEQRDAAREAIAAGELDRASLPGRIPAGA